MPTPLYAALFFLIIFLGSFSVVAIRRKSIPVELSYPGLFLLIILSLVMTALSRPTLAEIGLIPPTLSAVLVYVGVTALAWAVMKRLKKPSSKKTIPYGKIKVFFYAIISAPAQEFFFRSFVYFSLGLMGVLNIYTMVLCSTVLFGFAHIGYNDKNFTYGSIALGAVWGVTYYFFPHLLLISLSHALVGIVAFSEGLIKPETFLPELERLAKK